MSFQGTQSDADSNFAQLLSFTSRHCPKLKQWINDKHNRAYKVTYTSPQSQNEFLSLLAMEVKEKTGIRKPKRIRQQEHRFSIVRFHEQHVEKIQWWTNSCLSVT